MNQRRLRRIYDASDIIEAHIVKGLLEQHDIFVYVAGYYLQGAIGEIPVTGNTTVWVEAEKQDLAQALVAQYRSTSP